MASKDDVICHHCNRYVSCDCESLKPIEDHALNCALRLFYVGNSHNGAGRRGEFDCY
jgi:hypothetical protein